MEHDDASAARKPVQADDDAPDPPHAKSEGSDVEPVRLGADSGPRACLAGLTALFCVLFTTVGMSAFISDAANRARGFFLFAFGVLFFGGATVHLFVKAFPATMIFRSTDLVLVRPLRARRIIRYAELTGAWVGHRTTTAIVDHSAVHEHVPTRFLGVGEQEVVALFAPDELARQTVLSRIKAGCKKKRRQRSR